MRGHFLPSPCALSLCCGLLPKWHCRGSTCFSGSCTLYPHPPCHCQRTLWKVKVSTLGCANSLVLYRVDQVPFLTFCCPCCSLPCTIDAPSQQCGPGQMPCTMPLCPHASPVPSGPGAVALPFPASPTPASSTSNAPWASHAQT